MFRHWLRSPSAQNRQWPQGRDGETATRSPTASPSTPAPELGDMAGDLVAEDHRLPQPHRAEAAVAVVVQVRTADAAGREPDADLAGTGRRDLAGLDAQVLGGMNDDRAHGWPHRTGVGRGRPAKCAVRLSRTSWPIALRVSTVPEA